MTDENRKGLTPIVEGMEVANLADKINKGMEVVNLAQAINQNMTAQPTARQGNANTDGGQGKEE